MIHSLASVEMSLLEELWRYFVEHYLTPDYGMYENITINYDPLISPATVFVAVFVAIMTASAVFIFNKRVLGRLVRRLIKQRCYGQENAKSFAELGLEKSLAHKLFINRYTLLKAVRCREEDEFYGIEPRETPDEELSIGIENTERIKVPFWRRKHEKTAQNNCEIPCNISDSEISYSVASNGDAASHLDADQADAAQIFSANDSDATQKGEKCDADKTVVAPKDSYEASLVAKVKYKRKPTDHFYVEPSKRHRLSVQFDKKGTNPFGLVIIAAAVIIAGVLIIKALPWVLGLFDGILGEFSKY